MEASATTTVTAGRSVLDRSAASRLPDRILKWGLTVLAGAMIDRQLRDAETAVVSEHGDEAMQLAVEPQAVHHFCAVRLQAAVHVVEANT